MNFDANQGPVEIIKDNAFGGTNFRDIYYVVNEKCYRKSKNLMSWKILIKNTIL